MHKVTTILAGFGFTLMACGPLPPPPVTPVVAGPTKELGIFVDPDVEVGTVQDEKGRELVGLFHDALATALSDAGYHVVAATSSPHELIVHAKLARVGYEYGSWGDGVAIEVRAGDAVVAHAGRASLNFVHLEGATTSARVTFAARELVNHVFEQVNAFAKSRPATPPAAVGPTGSG